jgi:hypothetical protein
MKPVVDFVGNEPNARALRDGNQAGERLPRHHRACRIGRAADQHSFERFLAMSRE